MLPRTSLARTSTLINGGKRTWLSPFSKTARTCALNKSCGLILGSGMSTLNSKSRRSQLPVAVQTRLASSTPLKDKWSLRGKVTVVTGGARGIGLALATVSAEFGSDIAIIDTLEQPHPDFEKLSDFGVKAKYYRSDVTKPELLTKTFDDIASQFGHIDNCITAAGIVLDKPYLDHEYDESMRILNVNVMGTFLSAQAASKHMVSQGTGGSIVMIASVSSHCAIPSQRISMYGASKGAVRILARHLAVEMAPYNIRVNTISPGYIATDLTKKLGDEHPELLSVFESAAPIKRMGERDDLTGIVAYLLTNLSTYTTGADVRIDGALAAGRI